MIMSDGGYLSGIVAPRPASEPVKRLPTADLIREIELLRGTDSPSNIVRRVRYDNPQSLLRRLYRNAPRLAASLDRELRLEASLCGGPQDLRR